jgi:formylglycine-generating enzyme required for sulfatase activity
MTTPVRLRRWFIPGMLMVLMVGAAAQSGEAPRNRAVIIGINGYYRVGKLKYCVADAKAVRDQLVRGGVFAPGDVVLMTDDASEPQHKPTLGNLESRLENLHTFAKGADTLLVFFAGHGEMTGEGEQRHGVLIPIDGSKTRGIPLADIRAWLAKCEARNTLLILDACHAGEGERAVRTIAPTLAAGAGLVVLASCTEDQQSYDVPDRGHGVFSLFLANGLAGQSDANGDGDITVDELFAYVHKGVSDWAYRKDRKQTPVRLPERASGTAVLARVSKSPTPEVVKLSPLPSVPALPSLPSGQHTLDEWVKQLAECEKVLSDAKKFYTPTSAHIRTAEANLRSAQEGVRTAILNEWGPRYKALVARRRELARDMLPTHPAMQELVRRIESEEAKLLPLAGCLTPDDFKQLSIHLVFNKWPFDSKEAKLRQQITAASLGVPVEKVLDLGGGVKLELVLIPAGEFMMGSPANEAERGKDEGPQHKVRLTKPFYMGKHEVTQEQWERVMGNNPSHFKGAKHPVEKVSWNDTQEFIKKLNARVGEKGAFGLPTESEWEYACRAGTGTPFHTGNTISTDQANYDGNYTYGAGRKGAYREKTMPVGSLASNAFGLYDMHGNVYEWCQDWFADKYPGGERTDPPGPATGQYRVLRGGSWNLDPWNCRSAYRGGVPPAGRSNIGGFRLLCRDF